MMQAIAMSLAVEGMQTLYFIRYSGGCQRMARQPYMVLFLKNYDSF